MKKSLIILTILFLFVGCTTNSNNDNSDDNDNNTDTPKVQYTISIQGQDPIKIDQSGDYLFKLPSDTTFNKVFVNGNEIVLSSNKDYLLRNIQEDLSITYNKQYQITLSSGEGYQLSLLDNALTTINEGDTISFKLTIDPAYSNSIPIVEVNSEFTKSDFIYTISNIQKDIHVSVFDVKLNEVIIDKDYSSFVNNDLSWWYRIPSPLNAEVKPSIDAGIANIINQHKVLWMSNTTSKQVVLTMDEGYEYENNTNEILDIAKEKKVSIVFFITGGYIDANPELVLRMVNEGHMVANHTDKHLRAPTALTTSNDLLINDIKTLAEKYRNLTGQEIAPYYRPPEGGYSQRSLAITDDLGYTTVFWSFAYRDWLVDNQPDTQLAYNQVMSQLHPGSIILLHAVSDTNVAILSDLIDGIRAQGYTFATLP